MPNDWPELLGQLVSVINERKNTPAVDGAVRCLATFVEDLDDVQLVQVIPRMQSGKPGSHPCSFAPGVLSGHHACMGAISASVSA